MSCDFSIERGIMNKGGGDAFVIGVDEAGRGPWAGPVVAGAAWINPDAPDVLPDGIDDSKKLSGKKRGALWRELQAIAKNPDMLRMATAVIEVDAIDRMGILPATFVAMERAVMGLGFHGDGMDMHLDAVHLLVDGTLAPPCREMKKTTSRLEITPVKKGDGKSLSIAIAAIAAKETRDGLMRRLDAAYPAYGWGSNMGYGTAAHHAALRAHGVSPQHRRSFKPVARLIRAP